LTKNSKNTILLLNSVQRSKFWPYKLKYIIVNIVRRRKSIWVTWW